MAKSKKLVDLEKIAFEHIQKLEDKYRKKNGGIPLWVNWMVKIWISGYQYARKENNND